MKKAILKILCFLILLIMALNYANNVLKVKYDDGIYGLTKFYELEENSIDVLILGSSHAFQNFNTGVLWEKYGIASFVLGGSAQPLWNTYYYLKEALKTQTPQLIILEGYATTFTSEFADDSQIIKNNYGLKWSKDKVDAIKISSSEDRQRQFLLEYTQYHTRYSELSKEDFFKNKGNPKYIDWKGLWCNMATTSMEALDVTNVMAKTGLYDKTEKYYRMIIELAQEKSLPILVVISPWPGITEESQSIFNMAEEIAAEYEVPFINYNLKLEDIGIDYAIDVADRAHLNYRGNQKYTCVVGEYIKDNFDITDHRGEPGYETWQRDADYIHAMIDNQAVLEATERKDLLKRIEKDNYRLFISIDGAGQLEEADLYHFFDAKGIKMNKNGVYYIDNSSDDVWSSGKNEMEKYFTLEAHDFCLKRIFNESESCLMNQIIIDNKEYKKVDNGINIVVYDVVTQDILISFGLDGDKEYQIVK